MFSRTSLAEESIEGIIASSNSLVTWHLTVRLDSVFQAIQLPAGIADLHSGLADMDGYTLTLKVKRYETEIPFGCFD